MKKMILLFACMGMMFCSFAQQIPTEKSQAVHTREEYLQKSKKLWRAAIIMVSVGGAMTITGLALALSNNNSNYGYDNYDNDNEEIGAGLVLGGSLIMLGSLGCSIPAHIYKKKAMSLSFKNEPAPLLQRGMVFNRSIPSVSLKIGL